eukprot:jgi/Chlat1/8362/Chrsp80S07789
MATVCSSTAVVGLTLPSRPAAALRQQRRQPVRCQAMAEQPVNRPTLKTPTPPSAPAPSSSTPPVAAKPSVVTVEAQRQIAKQMVAYFENLKYEQEVEKNRIFGFSRKNEVGNGRWAMFGFFVGLLTEYATGVDFVGQLKLIIANLGIADIAG